VRAYEFLCEELDKRSKLQKLADVINHPATEDTIRQVAQSKAKLLFDQMTEEEREVELARAGILEIKPLAEVQPSRITVATNINESDLERPFVMGVTLGQLYENLSKLSPRPSNIQFLRQGQIHLMVPPPFQNMTKTQFIQCVESAAPGVQKISSTFLEGRGYHFVLSFL
jgi:hypothetical protein